MKSNNLKIKDPSVFVSYCWVDSKYVDKIETVFSSIGKHIIRDIRDAKDYTSIKEFMKKIKTSNYVILIISHSYMKSKNCMYEILELLKNENYKNQILPIIIKDNELDIYSDNTISKYIKFWKTRYDDLNNDCNVLSPEEKVEQYEVLRIIKIIQSSIGSFISTLQDLKAPSLNELEVSNYLPIRNKIWHHTSVFNLELINRCLLYLSNDNIEIVMERNTVDNPVVFGDWLLNSIEDHGNIYSFSPYKLFNNDNIKVYELYVDIIKVMNEKTATTIRISNIILEQYKQIVLSFISKENNNVYQDHNIFEDFFNNIIRTNIKLIDVLNSIGYFKYKLFNPAIFLCCINYISSIEDRELALEKYTETDYVLFGSWLLDLPLNNYARGAYHIIISALIIKGFSPLTEIYIKIRDGFIDSIMNDSFEYDWEYNDWVQLRKHALINALAIIGDENSVNALKSRFNNEINIETKIKKAEIIIKNDIINIQDFLRF